MTAREDKLGSTLGAGASTSAGFAPLSSSAAAASGSSAGALDADPDVIVLDFGTGSIKCGWAGEDAPRVVIPTLLLDHAGQAMPASVIAAAASSGGGAAADGAASGSAGHHHLGDRAEYAVGQAALSALHLASTRLGNTATSHLNLLRPIERGEIKDYEGLQKICDHIFKNELRVNPKDHPVMLTVSPLCSPEQRQELAKLMFEVFAVPALCMANQAVLSLYSTGRTTGLVCELGEGMTYVVPIYEGFALKHAVLSLPIAGMDLTKYLSKLLSGTEAASSSSQSNNRASLGGSGGNLSLGGGNGNSGSNGSVWSFALESNGGAGSGGSDIVRDIKEKLCRVKASKWEYNVVAIQNSNAATAVAQATAGTAAAAAAATVDTDETSYELPDGTMIRLDDHCRFNSLEILFAPEKYAQSLGMHLTGGANQSFGIPAQQQSSPTSTSGGGSASAAAAAAELNRLSSAGGGSSGGPTTPSSGPLGSGNNPPGSAGSGVSFSSHFGSVSPAPAPARQGPITIDLSTNDLLGVHSLVYHSLGMCDSFLRRELLHNIVLAGGTSMAKGFGDRMRRELTTLLQQEAAGGVGISLPSQQTAAAAGAEDAETSAAAAAAAAAASSPLNIITDSQRKYAAWIGASMYASLPTFQAIKITAEQYKRDENVVHKKFF